MGTGILQCWESNRLAVMEVWRSPHSKITIGVSLAQLLERERDGHSVHVYIYMIKYFTFFYIVPRGWGVKGELERLIML